MSAARKCDGPGCAYAGTETMLHCALTNDPESNNNVNGDFCSYGCVVKKYSTLTGGIPKESRCPRA